MTKTILEYVNKLYKYFYTNSIFNIDSDFSKIFENSNNIDLDKAILIEALKTLEEKKVIKKVEYVSNKKSTNTSAQTCWVLIYPLQLQDQNIELSATSCLAIANMINSVGELMENKELICDVTNITEEDILKLINILGQFVESFNKFSQKNRESEEDNS